MDFIHKYSSISADLSANADGAGKAGYGSIGPRLYEASAATAPADRIRLANQPVRSAGQIPVMPGQASAYIWYKPRKRGIVR
jgi:hypothetical protein